MSDLSLCALAPKPLAYCVTCRRNPANVPPSEWHEDWIRPTIRVPDGCDYWIPTGYKTLAEVRKEFERE